MYSDIFYQTVFGIPYIVIAGIITLVFLFSTYIVIFLNKKGIHRVPVKWHFILGKITVFLAIIHGIFGILLYVP